MAIELRSPAIGERLRAARRVPTKLGERRLPAERSEERRGEEMTVRVVDHVLNTLNKPRRHKGTEKLEMAS